MVPEALLDGIANTKIAADDAIQSVVVSSPKKKRRKRTKKSTVGKSESSNGVELQQELSRVDTNVLNSQGGQNVLWISRNKHWKYISAYHGPWLQLPVELLESLLVLNLDPATVSGGRRPTTPSFPSDVHLSPSQDQGHKGGFERFLDGNTSLISSSTPDEQEQRSLSALLPPSPTARTKSHRPPLLHLPPGKVMPPPIDPGVFRSVTTIRRLIDEAAELAVRASSGLSAVALGSLQAGGGGGGGGGGGLGGGGMGGTSTFGLTNGAWAAAQALGLGPLLEYGGGGGGGGLGGGGRNVPMSATRVHRLRALAVQKLATAYRADEIASSVMVMQRGSVFDDTAEKVLKIDPKNVDARYVHFFHEKIPSRELAESTSTTVLDQLIAENPQRLEFYRTRAIVHCFRDEYTLAAKDFSYVLKESRVIRKARQAHTPAQRSSGESGGTKARRKKIKVNGQAPPDGTAAVIEGPDGEQLFLHPSVLPDAPEPIELQVLFLRGSSYYSHAHCLIEEVFFTLEGISRVPLNDFGEMQLCNVRGRYGGIEVNNTDGPLGRSDGAKARAYRAALGEGPLREQICVLLKKSKRDHEKFLAHFDSLEPTAEAFKGIDRPTDTLGNMERAFALLDTYRPIIRQQDPPTSDAQDVAGVPLSFTTYHPLILEAHFSILNCLLMLGEFENLTSTLERTASIVSGLEGYAVFVPPRSMSQGEFMEVLERLASGWMYGKMPNALVRVQKQPMRASQPRYHPSLELATGDDDYVIASSSSAGPSTATSSCSTKTPPTPGRRLSLSEDAEDRTASRDLQAQLRVGLEHLRFLLAPIHVRLRKRAERASEDELEKPAALSLALHSARVEIVLAWLGAVHLPELEEVAT